MLKDLQTKEDIKLMVDSFYEKVNKDELLGTIFNDVANTNWDVHLPKMYTFWNTLLLGTKEYSGSPFNAHVPLPLNKIHFDRWVEIFNKNIDENFEGAMTEQVKLRAYSIAYTFRSKLEFLHKKEENGFIQ